MTDPARPQGPFEPLVAGQPPIDPEIRIGHVHLKVADLERAVAFYHGVLGFEITQRYGHQAAFLAAGGYHHHIGLNTWESAGGSPPPPGTTGLFHIAILYPTRALLADALRRLIAAGIALVLLGRERAAWLAVPVLWPATQLHYTVIALPALTPFLAAFAAPNHPGYLAVGVICYAFWVRRDFFQRTRLRLVGRRRPVSD
jgi:catechol 2,3-dioxygenase-like lactoylglutathione lyase family enzyme